MSDFESRYVQYQPSFVDTDCWVKEVPIDATTPYDTVICADHEWMIHLKWKVSGYAVPTQAGAWHVNAYLESIGPGQDIELTGGNMHVIPLVGGQTDYIFEYTVPANTVPVEFNRSTPYKLVVTVVFRTPLDTPGEMAGCVEFPILQFYKPE